MKPTNLLTSLILLLVGCLEVFGQSTRTSTNFVTATLTGSTITSIITRTDYPTNTPIPPTNNDNKDSDSSSGGGNKTIIAAGASVGAAVVLSAIGIFIFRRWKLRPTAKFENKLQADQHYQPRQHASNRDDTVFLRELNEY
ncbi:hypothetical protein K493DRAFT_342191 [Basidiobolus meristosporus CBS 931.73]|uniref:Mid2 domain-containing protein n=1 Tax=Basidiobolus meristosporus CBS 931.73 TaxID=1314790 RepID=A0A1Y1X9H4_9FUNG|nr:hypothetical protein K493DRAFT_342191 [Basidiobolus meristosporus CBS 931.73]|eukprot:ORX82397.1 hypothetical protein K493DRAFT_342191 [Basidiobolus meristosporus CBS 931.73]